MKKGIKRVIIIIIILLALFFCKIFINHQYSLWYIKKFGIEYNTKRKKLGYELLNSDWVRTYSYNRKKMNIIFAGKIIYIIAKNVNNLLIVQNVRPFILMVF
jgi:hypothetical protein